VQPVSAVSFPNSPVQLNQLPPGILAFDGELKHSTIHEGEAQAHFIFNLTNISQQPVVIDDVKTSCGCTVAQLPQVPWNLKPRENGQIQVTVNVPGKIQTTLKEVTIITPQGVKTLRVEATILPGTNLPAINPH